MTFRISRCIATLTAGLALTVAGAAHAGGATAKLAPQVQTAGGSVRGVVDDGIAIFRGIPFAGDTAGAARWRPPSPAPQWRGVRDASQPGPICPQSTNPRSAGDMAWMANLKISEDCLNLAVYSPDLTPKRAAPVMVWIHGGAARLGSGSKYDGRALAQRGVVLVTINYRLDRLGLFAHPALSRTQSGEPLANYGLMDMAAALRWVQSNITAFGGDPANVTIAGQSSGAVAVTSLMVSPLTKGLYHRAIAQSGTASPDYPVYLSKAHAGSPSLESDGETVASALKIDPNGDIPAQLRALPWQAIIDYTDQQRANALVPVIDGWVIPDNVGRLFANNRNHPTPLIIGTTGWEQSLIARFNLPLAAVLRDTTPAAARAEYAGVDDSALSGTWFADSLFHAPAHYLADQNARQGQPTFVYRFDHLGATVRGTQPGAAHGDDVPYVFDRLPATADDQDRALAQAVADYWTRFARTGNPNGPGLPDWPAYPDDDGAALLLDTPITVGHNLLNGHLKHHEARMRQAIASPESAL